MKILLLKPISPSHIIAPPVGLGYLAAALRRDGHQPELLDCTRTGMGWDEFRAIIRETKPDLVGIQMWSCDFESVARSLAIIKETNPKTITVVGGAHPSGDPLHVLDQFPTLDYAFRGEGEPGFPGFVTALEQNDRAKFPALPGLIWRGPDGKTVANEQCFPADLDALGLPAWDLMDPRTYPEAPHQGFAKAFPTAPIVVSRGCPFPCTFCATRTLTGKKIRFRSLESVIEEIVLLRDTYGVKEIHIEDDNFTANREFVRAFCERLLADGITLWWYASSGVRLDTLDHDTLQLMKKAGCYTITIAIESGVQRVLDLMKKQTKVDDVRRRVAAVNAAGFEPTGLFIIGFPGETKADIEESIRFAKSLQLKRAQFAIFHPLPGSEIYEQLKASGELKEVEWSKLRPTSVAYTPAGITDEELKRYQQRAFLSFHLRPRILLKQFRDVTSLRNLIFIIKRVWDYLFATNHPPS